MSTNVKMFTIFCQIKITLVKLCTLYLFIKIDYFCTDIIIAVIHYYYVEKKITS